MNGFLLGVSIVHGALLIWASAIEIYDHPVAFLQSNAPSWLLLTILALPTVATGLTAYAWTLMVGPCRLLERSAVNSFPAFLMGLATAILTTLLAVGALALASFDYNEELAMVLAALCSTSLMLRLMPATIPGQCLTCGYDVRRSLDIGRCPECGISLRAA